MKTYDSKHRKKNVGLLYGHLTLINDFSLPWGKITADIFGPW